MKTFLVPAPKAILEFIKRLTMKKPGQGHDKHYKPFLTVSDVS
ncbi:hypothetical protein [Pseudoalteromonas sp. H105]|nr:hypothetical protein [Pseudoalteromonas sp. H105]